MAPKPEDGGRYMLASGHAMCLAWGKDQTFFYNDAYAPMLGVRHPSALGQSFADVWPEIWGDIAPLVDRTFAGETVTFKDMPLVMTRNGYPEDTWWSFSYSPIRDERGDVAGLLNVTLETTARVYAERERDAAVARLNDSETRLRALLNASSDAIYTMNADWSEMLLLDGRGFIADKEKPSVRWVDEYLFPEDKEIVQSAIDRAITDKKVFELEHRVRRADGSAGWTFSRAAPIFDDKGNIVEWFGMAADITARHEARSQLKQLNETLEVRIEERSRALLASEDQLRQMQKLEAIGQLTGGVAHDFNNLLTIIRSSADLLRRHELTQARRQRYIDAISDTADRAAKLTGQLLAFARRQALLPEVFDVEARVASISDILRTVLGARVQLIVNAACDTCFIEADVSQFETALVNMAVNARDAMDGIGTLTISVSSETSVPALRGHAAVNGRFVALSISDTGAGMAPDRLERIFEPFFTTKEVGKGTGLGLSQVYGFAKQSGGEVDVLSKVGEGATFRLYLPQADRPVGDSAPQNVEQTMPTRGNVLVVEDNDQVGEFASQLLTDLGYATRRVGSADAALVLLENDHASIDIVFSDVVMPGLSGVELGRRIRETWPSIAIVLTSGYSHILAEDARHGFDLLHKPYSVEELSRILRQARRSKT